jgi:hypothetical protein
MPEEHMGTERDRVISITLTEAEYRAFVAAQPQPVSWLRERILEAARSAGESQPQEEARQVA